MDHWHYVQETLLLLGTAMLLGALFERFRQSAIVGYLLAGCLLGPGALHFVSNDAILRVVAEVGVALLLFTIGLEFSFQRLVSMGATAIGGGTLQILVTALVFAGVGALAGMPLQQSLALGLVVAPSSTACVLRLLRDRAELDNIHGRNSVGILLLQDLALVPMVVMMTSMGKGMDTGDILPKLAIAVGFFALLAVIIYLTSVYLVPRAFSAATLLRNREILILLATVMALGAMWLAHLLSVSPALGAFIAGMLLAESPFATQIRADVGTPRVLLVTLFFASAGMAADFGWISGHWRMVLSGICLVMFFKAVIVWVILRVFRQATVHALATGVCLAQIGEFSFVLAEIGNSVGVIEPQLRQLMVSVTVGTLLLTPLLVSVAPRVAARLARPEDASGNEEETGVNRVPLQDHVVIVGYGPAGRSVAKALTKVEVPFVILELNHLSVSEARAEGLTAVIGDATQEDVLHHVSAAKARAVVITIPDRNAAVHMVQSMQALAPEVPVIVRSRYHRHMDEFAEAGAAFIIDEETQVGEFLGKSLVRGLSRVLPRPKG